jgi:hypothetical protein
MKPSRAYGVDFSGAKDADSMIWIAGGPITDDWLQLDVNGRIAPGSASSFLMHLR